MAAARGAVVGDELSVVLAQPAYRDVRDAVADLRVLYVPMQVVGCVFQALQPAEPVIKK
jgi:hypothetical protein